VSRIERGLERQSLGFIRRYVEALGGQLEVVVAIEGRRVRIRG
jgi:hypothetical protein